ncbi:hypothetical protein LARV_01205 [Longilinea arvoryzae]|uniref:Fibronectin type-III domain-containing protein n=1 Tax=Longilinea arvoryzae TaxID=360412 RepID=A0A0S7BHW8_9CHLR|nr:fibronectin type III domain-containing protein [Longilinea arvoryzae]GAP13451.1 hypothetical protein LARV_01205 [Longilinea arvoryzae]
MIKRGKFRFIVQLGLALAFLISSAGMIPVHAQSTQTLNPSSWQTSSTGLRTTQNTYAQTAGLGFVVTSQSWPYLTLHGGVKDAGAYIGYRLMGPIGIPLGQVKVSGASGSLAAQTTDWSHNQLTYSYGGGQMQFYVSRMSAAVALQTGATSLTLFNGSLPRYAIQSDHVARLSDGAAYPKYVAYSSGGAVQVKALSSSTTSLSGLDANWALVWYGNNSHFVDTRRPLSYDWTLLTSDAYQADAPMLLVFQNKPTSIKQASGGGVELAFSSAAGVMSILPFDGRLTRSTTETESWAGGLPTAVKNKITWWAARSCEFPLSVAETYGYDAPTDTTSITENFNFLTVCSGGIRLAPLPATVALARDALPITFSGNVVDGGLSTEFGPSQGIEGVGSYTWSMSGLRDYVDNSREVQDGGVPAELTDRLNAEVQKVVSSGHYAPWIFLDGVPNHRSRGDVYWANPADGLLHLIEVADAVSDPTLRTSLVNYIKSERATYPPETVYNLSVTQGKLRGPFSTMDSIVQYYWNPKATADDTRQWSFLQDVPLYSFYALARYYSLTGEVVPASTWSKAQETLDRDMREQDWGTFYWFANYQDRRVAVENANRHFAGMIGFVRLAEMTGDSASENLGRALLLKAAAMRAGMGRYARYLGATQLTQIPASPDWMMVNRNHTFIGYLYNYSWANEYDDSRQVIYLNQFAVDLNDYNYLQEVYNHLRDDLDNPRGQDSPSLAAFRDMVPELGKFLKDWSWEDADVVVRKVQDLWPQWYAAYAEGTLGWEHNLAHPVDSFQIFMAKAWIEDATPEELGRYADISWLDDGDFFYMQKLAEAVKAYRGVAWSGSDSLTLSAIPGDGYLLLRWKIVPDQDEGYTWRIDISGPGAPSPISGLPFATRSYLITGLKNYQRYTLSISAVDSTGAAILTSPTVTGFPSDILIYLPAISKGWH